MLSAIPYLIGIDSAINGNIQRNGFCLTGTIISRAFWVRDLPKKVIGVDPRDEINSLSLLAFS